MSGRRSRKVQLMDPLVGLGPTAARSTSGPTIQQTAPDHRGQQRSVILPGSEAMSDEICRSLDGRFSLARKRSQVRPRVKGMPTWLPPHLLGGLDDQAELGNLLVVSEQVALDGGGEAALRRQAQLLQRHERAGG